MTYDLSEEERNEFFILIAKKLLPNDIMRKLANLEKLSPEEIGLFSRCTNLVRKYCEEHVRLPESGTLLTEETLKSALEDFFSTHTVNARITRPEKPSAEKKERGSIGFTVVWVAHLFMVAERTVRRWENSQCPPPIGYSRILRLSGDWARLIECIQTYHRNRLRSDFDAYNSKLLIHFKDEQHLYKLVAGTDTNRTL